ncbi:MAG: ACT domain-containing protein [Cellulosilyticaceae bacterium]
MVIDYKFIGKSKEEQRVKGIITVVGKDKVGIIGKVCTTLSEAHINILDISQTILQGYFNMMMIVDMGESTKAFDIVVDELQVLGQSLEVDIKLQHEQIFDSMHRI